jgi:hypothetical protein
MHTMTVYGGRGAPRGCRQLHGATHGVGDPVYSLKADRPRAGLVALENREIPHSYQESNHNSPADQSTA